MNQEQQGFHSYLRQTGDVHSDSISNDDVRLAAEPFPSTIRGSDLDPAPIQVDSNSPQSAIKEKIKGLCSVLDQITLNPQLRAALLKPFDETIPIRSEDLLNHLLSSYRGTKEIYPQFKDAREEPTTRNKLILFGAAFTSLTLIKLDQVLAEELIEASCTGSDNQSFAERIRALYIKEGTASFSCIRFMLGEFMKENEDRALGYLLNGAFSAYSSVGGALPWGWTVARGQIKDSKIQEMIPLADKRDLKFIREMLDLPQYGLDGKPLDFNPRTGVNQKLIHIQSTVKDRANLLKALAEFCDSAKSLSLSDLCFILENIPRGVKIEEANKFRSFSIGMEITSRPAYQSPKYTKGYEPLDLATCMKALKNTCIPRGEEKIERAQRSLNDIISCSCGMRTYLLSGNTRNQRSQIRQQLEDQLAEVIKRTIVNDTKSK